MMEWVDELKELIPDYAKDIKLNLDSVIKRSKLEPEVAEACALAAAVATGSGKIVNILSIIENEIERDAAMTAASSMAMTNLWYPYVEMTGDPQLKGLPAQLRMNSIMTHGGTTKSRFEAYSLSASIVGKCEFCIKAHYEALKGENYTIEQLRDIGRIAAVINAVSKIIK